MPQDLFNTLRIHHQEHLIPVLQKATPHDREKLEKQLSTLPWEELPALIRDYVLRKPVTAIPDDLRPAPFFPFHPESEKRKQYYAKAELAGKELLSQGKAAVLTVAGGQGTRLGFDGPKGTYPITPILHKSLFQYFAESIARASEKYASKIHWYILTSKINDTPTRSFFENAKYFGLDPECVTFFTQAMMPAISADGKLLLAAKDSLALAPNGHGGTLLALRTSGALEQMENAGIEYLSYFQVDNPLVPVLDPLFLGLHHLEHSEMSARMLPKTGPFEKLGNFCISNRRLHIIEYSDMPRELAERRNADGSLAFLAGSPAIHIFSRSFIERLTTDGRLRLPWHRADKKVPYLDENGTLVKPEQPNAVKLESFIFDALPLAEQTLILEGERADLFAPVKNATGIDSAESCRTMLIERDVRRMEQAGIKIPRKPDGTANCIVEISPRSVMDIPDAIAYFKSNPPGKTITPGSKEAFGR